MTNKTPATTSSSLRSAHLVRAAELRALLLAFLSQVGVFVTIEKIMAQLEGELEMINCSETNVARQLGLLTKNGLVTMTLRGRVGFYAKSTTKPKELTSDVTTTPLESQSTLLEEVSSVNVISEEKQTCSNPIEQCTPEPTLRVDVIKATGRLRIEYAGLVIEIGSI